MKKYAIIIAIVLSFLVLYVLHLTKTDEIEQEEEIIEIKEVNEVSTEVKKMFVDIKGAVKNPGVYEMQKNDRIVDVIKKSGGLTKLADTSLTNLAYEITDGMSLIIYTKAEVKKLITVDTEKLICPTPTNNDCLIDSSNDDMNTLISINKATSSQLQSLPGIGPATAEKIINYRNESGSFITIEDIKNVSGIGDSIFAKIKDLITL